MAGDGARRLGPVARKLICPDKWADGYPGPPAYVKELDVLLRFADEKGCLHRFVPTLESRGKQRDEAINELRLAYLFENLGFPIVAWDPPGLNGRIGEFMLEVLEKTRIFTEIKSPGWESELSQAAIDAGRAKEPKYKGLGGGAVGNWRAVLSALHLERPTQSSRQRNLICSSSLMTYSSSCFTRYSRSKVRFTDPRICTKSTAISRRTGLRISVVSVSSIVNRIAP